MLKEWVGDFRGLWVVGLRRACRQEAPVWMEARSLGGQAELRALSLGAVGPPGQACRWKVFAKGSGRRENQLGPEAQTPLKRIGFMWARPWRHRREWAEEGTGKGKVGQGMGVPWEVRGWGRWEAEDADGRCRAGMRVPTLLSDVGD